MLYCNKSFISVKEIKDVRNQKKRYGRYTSIVYKNIPKYRHVLEEQMQADYDECTVSYRRYFRYASVGWNGNKIFNSDGQM